MAKTLDLKKKKFAKIYATNGRNGFKAVKEVFGLENDNSARVKASRLITNDNISKEIIKVEKSIADYFSAEDVAKVQKEQLIASRMDHMVFPLGPEGEDDINLSGGIMPKQKEVDEDIEDENEDRLP